MWGFPFFIVFDCAANGRLQTLTSVELSIFYHAANGRLQTLASVRLSVSNHIYLRRMIHYGLLASVGLAQARPNNQLAFLAAFCFNSG